MLQLLKCFIYFIPGLSIKQLLSMYMEDARLKTKRKGFEITQGRGWASSCSGVNLLFIASLNVFRTERQYFVLPGWK